MAVILDGRVETTGAAFKGQLGLTRVSSPHLLKEYN
jgi:hypothetical protein